MYAKGFHHRWLSITEGASVLSLVCPPGHDGFQAPWPWGVADLLSGMRRRWRSTSQNQHQSPRWPIYGAWEDGETERRCVLLPSRDLRPPSACCTAKRWAMMLGRASSWFYRKNNEEKNCQSSSPQNSYSNFTQDHSHSTVGGWATPVICLSEYYNKGCTDYYCMLWHDSISPWESFDLLMVTYTSYTYTEKLYSTAIKMLRNWHQLFIFSVFVLLFIAFWEGNIYEFPSLCEAIRMN